MQVKGCSEGRSHGGKRDFPRVSKEIVPLFSSLPVKENDLQWNQE